MNKLQVSNPSKSHIIYGKGDSQTDYLFNNGVSAANHWGPILSRTLNLNGCYTKARTTGNAGYTSCQVLGLSDLCFLHDNGSLRSPVPSIAILYCGVNDVAGNSFVTSATAQAGSTSTTIVLASTTLPILNSYFGQTITINSGTGSGQTKTIIGFSINSITTTCTITVDSAWTVTPDATSVYSITAPNQSLQQASQQALIKVFKYKVTGAGAGLGQVVNLWSQSQLPANGSLGQRYIVFNDTSSTGGAPVNNTIQNPNITTNYSASPIQAVWEFRNEQAGEAGWGRVAIASTPSFSDGVSKVITISTNYLNYSTAGDSYNVTAGTGTKYTGYVIPRAASLAAATAEGTIYCDLYSYQSMLIYGGTFLGNTILSETTQGSFSWHIADSNQHHNQYGHAIVARALYLTIQNQSGWLQSLV